MHLFSPLKPEHNANAVDGWRSRSEKTKTPHQKKKKTQQNKKNGRIWESKPPGKDLGALLPKSFWIWGWFLLFSFLFFFFFFNKTFLDEFQWFFLSLYLKMFVISHYFWLYVSWFWALFTFLWYGFIFCLFLFLFYNIYVFV